MRGWLWTALLTLAACGRYSFDPLADGALDAAAPAQPNYAYARGSVTNTIGILDVGADGELTEAASSPYSLGAVMQYAIADPSGRYLYVVAGDSTLRTFAIDRMTGALTQTDLDSVAMFPMNIAIHPNGRWLYVADDNGTNGVVFGFEVSGDGRLAPLAGSPWPQPASGSTWVEIDPLGRFAYVGSYNDELNGFAISPTTGVLTALPATPWDSGSGGSLVILIEGTGRFGFVAPDLSGGIPGFTIDPATGALMTTPGSEFGTASVSFSAAMNRDRTLLFIANQGLGQMTLSAFFVDQVAGALFDLPGSPVDPDGSAFTVSTSPVTDDLYVGADSIVHYRATKAGLEQVRKNSPTGVDYISPLAIVQTR